MAALTTFRDTQKRRHPAEQINEYPAANSTEFFSGGMVGMLAGVMVKASDTSGLIVTGRCEEDRITGGAGHGKTIRAFSGVFDWEVAGAPVVLSNLNAPVYVIDDQTVSLVDPGNTVIAGYVYDVDLAGVAWFTNLFPIQT